MAGLAANLRVVGLALALVGVAGLFLAGRRQRLAHAWLASLLFLAVMLATVLPWQLFNWQHRDDVLSVGSVTDYMGAVGAADLYAPASANVRVADLLNRVLHHARLYLFNLSDLLLGRPWHYLPGNPLAPWEGKLGGGFGVLLALLILTGAGVAARRGLWLPLLFAAAMQGILLLWPYVQERYALPLVPFFWFFLLLGLAWLRRQIARPWRQWATVGIALFLLGALSFQTAVTTAGSLKEWSRRQAPDISAYYYTISAQWGSYFEAGRWAADHAPAGTLLVARKPYLIYLYNERETMPFPWTADADSWLASLKENDAALIIEDAFTWSDVTDRYLRPVLRTRPDLFVLVYETPPPVTRVWRFTPPPVGSP